MPKKNKPFYKTNMGIIVILALVAVVGVIYLNPSLADLPLPANQFTWVIVDNGHPETTEALRPVIEKVLIKYESVTNDLRFINYFDTFNPKALPTVAGIFEEQANLNPIGREVAWCPSAPCDIDIVFVWEEGQNPNASILGGSPKGKIGLSVGGVDWSTASELDLRNAEQLLQHEYGHLALLGHSDGFWMNQFFIPSEDLSIELLADRLQENWGVCMPSLFDNCAFEVSSGI